MPDSTELRIASARERLQRSRQDIFALAHSLKGDQPVVAAGSGFPHSRIMRALVGERGRMVFGGAAIALTLLKPGIMWRLVRFAPLLRPLVMRYVLPRLLGQR